LKELMIVCEGVFILANQRTLTAFSALFHASPDTLPGTLLPGGDMTSVRAVLIPLDGSELAECALAAGAGTARRLNAFVHLVRVHTQLPLIAAEVVALSPQTEREVVEEEERYLEEKAAPLRRMGLAVSTAVVHGAIVPSLKTYIDRHGIGLVVMSSHGLGGIRRAIIGSVTDLLARTVSIPVLIVNPAMAGRVGKGWPRHVLVPQDGSALGSSALEALTVVDPLRTAHLSLATIGQPSYPVVGPWSFQMAPFLEAARQWHDFLRDQQQRSADKLRADGYQVTTHLLTGGKVARELLKLGTMRHCDLIVIATHGAGGIDRVMFGSVADQIIRHSRIPVLVIRPMVEAELTSIRPGEALAEAGA
jgi:nucleotide-binding universal stress UspA family protein